MYPDTYRDDVTSEMGDRKRDEKAVPESISSLDISWLGAQKIRTGETQQTTHPDPYCISL